MRAAFIFIVLTLVAVPVEAQGRRSGRETARVQGVPPGHVPPAGQCRVWYDGRPPGHQPPPTSCREAERVASRDREARVIYGGAVSNDGRWDRDRGGSNRPRAVPRRNPYPGGYPYPERYPYPGERDRYPERGPYGSRRDAYEGIPFENGYRDGYDKGEEDARDNDAFDPRRHGRYRSADRGYDQRLGSKDEYRDAYREGFLEGYEEGYRGFGPSDPDRRRDGWRLSWPF